MGFVLQEEEPKTTHVHDMGISNSQHCADGTINCDQSINHSPSGNPVLNIIRVMKLLSPFPGAIRNTIRSVVPVFVLYFILLVPEMLECYVARLESQNNVEISTSGAWLAIDILNNLCYMSGIRHTN